MKKKIVKVNIDVSCKYFSFLAYQISVKLLYETLDILIEALQLLLSDSLSFVDRLTDKSKHQTLKHIIFQEQNKE